MSDRVKLALDGLLSLSVAAIAVVVVYRTFFVPGAAPTGNIADASIPSSPISLDSTASLGSITAPVSIVVFSDFQCPFCRRFATGALADLRKTRIRDGEVYLSFRHLPLENIHPEAFEAAKASVCAAQNGQFWALHDAFFASDRPIAEQLAQPAPRETESYSASCLASEQTLALVRADAALARQLDVQGTPTIFIGSTVDAKSVVVAKRINGAVPFDELDRHIRALLPTSR